MTHLRPLLPDFLPWTTGAMRPSAILVVINYIFRYEPKLVVELGSGLSTVLLGRALSKLPDEAKLIAIEHDEVWHRQVTQWVYSAGLQAHVNIVFAPLVASGVTATNDRWYDTNAVLSAVETSHRPIDLLVVDGPPADHRTIRRSRYPALPVLQEKLAGHFAIILDDADRRGERWVLRQWSAELGIEFLTSVVQGGIAIGSRGRRIAGFAQEIR